MPQAYVDNVERLCAKVFRQLQKLVEAQTVAGAVAPVAVEVSEAFLDGSYGALPVEGVVGRLLSLNEASAREAHEGRLESVQQFGQVGAAAIVAVLERWREQRHHVEGHYALAVG